MKHHKLLGLTCLLVVAVCGSSHADAVRTVLLTSSSVEARLDGVASSPYTILRIAIPPEITASGLVRAILEVRADVQAQTIDGWMNETPIVEVYALSDDMTGSFNAAKLTKPSTMNRPIAVGSNKSVRIDITEAVVSWLENPSKNHGLVLGSFRGAREGSFTLKSDASREGALAAVTFLSR